MACGVMVVAYIQLATWHAAAYNQSERIRARLLHSILHQDIGWFDLQDAGEFSTRLVE
jgi:ABC-type multidrug transport system fused ATPase/permease subunit